ncbi:hypothetical protein FNT36_01945 [Hymenobacter setariae]|uniref:Glycosyltransferase RgtA/B/C/D-like domain-containing protein n=1 Tax=Hymenobacter setariae TaxID=2594794 RepID=A0A558C2G5_9BACT|nr:DUF6044 family protein [Hymenobacter setariae]TVT42877.1 hypothetical protein FNT36_01945 [Hymenobacter setariae]
MKPIYRALLGLLLFLLPLVALGPRTFILLHDNLEAEVVWAHLLAKLHLALAHGPGAVVQPIMDGLPRAALRSGLSVTIFIFHLLPTAPLAAYLLHEALVRVVGLLSMYWLLRRYGLAQPEQRGLAAAVALLWAALPAYSIFGLSVLGQPALLRAALDLRAGRARWGAWLVCAALPWWSSFVLVGPFVAVGWGLGLLLDLGRRGRAAWPATGRGLAGLAGLALLLASYVLVEWQLFYSLLVAKDFIAHREEFDLARLARPGLGRGLREATQLFWLGHYHASPFFKGGILLAVVVGLGRLGGAQRGRLGRQVAGLLAVITGLSLLAGLLPQVSAALQGRLPLLHAFSLGRFYFLLALPWVLVLVLVLRQLPSRRLAFALVALQVPFALAANPEFTNNVRSLAGRPKPDAPGYAAYVAPGLLGQARAFIQARTGQLPPAYRVACLGLPPAVAQFNGFYTLDSYQTLYPLAYKHAFRPLIAGELAKSPELATYFDAWGNRCYLFSAELGRDFLVGKRPVRTVQHWAFDAAAFRRLGGRYVLSAVRLARPAESGLRPLGVFDDSGAFWRLHLYEVLPPATSSH